MGIPDSVAKPTLEKGLPQSVAELPANIEAPEAMPYVISFAKYNEKLCEIEYLGKNKPKKALEVLKQIGTKVCCSADFQKYNIDRLPVYKNGDYKKLYNGLEEDVELKEIKLQQDARIFYYDIEPERKFCIVAITENHYETDKVIR